MTAHQRSDVTLSAEVLAARAATDPDGEALSVHGVGDLTFGDWERRSDAVARHLETRGVGAGDMVGLLFDSSHWADSAVAHLGVLKAGAVAALFPPGTAGPDLDRSIAHSGVAGVLCPAHLARPTVPMWVVEAGEPGGDHDGGSVRPRIAADAPPGLVHTVTPLGRPGGRVRPHRGPALDGGTTGEGWAVHAWAPGTLGGQRALQWALGRSGGRVACLPAFGPDRLCALVDERRAVAVGLTPAQGAALVASGALGHHDLRSVARLELSGSVSPALGTHLREGVPGASLVEFHLRAPPTPVDAPAAVSQEGMVWHEQFAPGSFNLPCLVRRYEGPLHEDAFRWAMAELVRRHQPLRSTFEVVDGRLCQHAGDSGPALAITDLAHLTPAGRDAEVARLLADATGRTFDLVTGPLFEPRLVRLGTDDHLLVVRLHHTVFDDWSVDVFRRELSALYTAGLAGAPSPLIEPPTTFADAARRQRARLDGEQGAAQRAWWRSELHGAPLSVQLAMGQPGAGPGRGPEAGGPVRLDLPPELAAEVRALAPRLRATPFMTVLSAFSVVLARCTGQDDLVISTVVAHRNQSDLEPLIGCFTKKVPLRLRVDGDPTFPELVARTRSSLLGALAHQDVSFEAAVQEGLGRAASEHGVVPQVSVVFQGETPQQVKVLLPGLATSRYEAPVEARTERHFSSGPHQATGREPESPAWGDGAYLGTFLILSLLETHEGLALVARGTFHRPEATRVLEQLAAQLADIVADPNRRLSQLAAPDEPAPLDYDQEDAGDVVEVRGFRARRSRLQAALATCPGVADVAVEVRTTTAGGAHLVAYVVPDGDGPPTLAQLRHAQWAALPGSMWPAAAVVVRALPRLPDGRLDVGALPPAGEESGPAPPAVVLAAMWGEIRGREAGPDESYWQDFSFLQALAEARQAGLAISDEDVARCRTPEMLAAAMAARAGPGPARQG